MLDVSTESSCLAPVFALLRSAVVVLARLEADLGERRVLREEVREVQGAKSVSRPLVRSPAQDGQQLDQLGLHTLARRVGFLLSLALPCVPL